MLNPFKEVIVYPRFRDRGWTSFRDVRLKRANKWFDWYAYNSKGIDIHDIKVYKPRAINMILEVSEIKDEPTGRLDHFLCCYSKQDGSYIGTPFDVFKFVTYFGIKDFYRSHPDNKVASIGFAPEKERWYGWSHRAIYSFGIGDKIKYNDDLLILSHGWIEGCPEYEEEKKQIQYVKSMFKEGILKIENLQQARFLAIRFADSIA